MEAFKDDLLEKIIEKIKLGSTNVEIADEVNRKPDDIRLIREALMERLPEEERRKIERATKQRIEQVEQNLKKTVLGGKEEILSRKLLLEKIIKGKKTGMITSESEEKGER